MLNGLSCPAIRRRDLTRKRANYQQTGQEQNGTTGMIGLDIPTRCAVIGTSGMIATGGTIIVTRSFSLSVDIIFWTEAIGTRPGATSHCRATTTTTGRFIPTVTCSQTKSSRTFKSPCKMQATILEQSLAR